MSNTETVSAFIYVKQDNWDFLCVLRVPCVKKFYQKSLTQRTRRTQSFQSAILYDS